MSSTPEHTGEDRPDETDRLLTAYFRSEVPSPWPSLPTPGSTRVATAVRNHHLTQSRLMLAASIATLLIGSWLLTGLRLGSGNFVRGPGASVHEGAAKVPMDLRPDSGRPAR